MAFFLTIVLCSLPMDVLREMMSYLPLAALKVCAGVCKYLRPIAQDAIWADPALNADHLHKVLSRPKLLPRIRHIRVMAAPDMPLDLATTNALRALLDATKNHLRGLSFLSGALDRDTFSMLASHDSQRPSAFHLTVLRISLPSWDDIALLRGFLCLSILDLNTSRTPLFYPLSPISCRINTVATFVWRHHDDTGSAAIGILAAVLALPSVNEFVVHWSWAQADQELTAALIKLQAAFTASSPRLSTYRPFITDHAVLAEFVRYAPSSVQHLHINCDIGPWCSLGLWYGLTRCIPDSVNAVTLATTIDGTVNFLQYLLNTRETTNIHLVIINPDYEQGRPCGYDDDARYTGWLSTAPHGGVFSDWTWSAPILHTAWGTTKPSFELHQRIQEEVLPSVGELKERGVMVVDMVGTAADVLL